VEEFSPVVFRPSLAGLAVAILAGVVSAAVPATFIFLKMGFAIYIGVGMSGIWWLFVLNLLFCRVGFHSDFLETGGIVRSRIPWKRIVKWSKNSADGAIFLQFDTGKVKTLDPWCVSGDRGDVAANLLGKFVGPESQGNDAVVPWFIALFTEIAQRQSLEISKKRLGGDAQQERVDASNNQ
jgi:hypothetical protein